MPTRKSLVWSNPIIMMVNSREITLKSFLQLFYRDICCACSTVLPGRHVGVELPLKEIDYDWCVLLGLHGAGCTNVVTIRSKMRLITKHNFPPKTGAAFQTLQTPLSGRVLAQGHELVASVSPDHFHGQRRCSRPIWHSSDAVVLAPVVSNLATTRWRVNLEGQSCLWECKRNAQNLCANEPRFDGELIIPEQCKKIGYDPKLSLADRRSPNGTNQRYILHETSQLELFIFLKLMSNLWRNLIYSLCIIYPTYNSILWLNLRI